MKKTELVVLKSELVVLKSLYELGLEAYRDRRVTAGRPPVTGGRRYTDPQLEPCFICVPPYWERMAPGYAGPLHCGRLHRTTDTAFRHLSSFPNNWRYRPIWLDNPDLWSGGTPEWATRTGWILDGGVEV